MAFQAAEILASSASEKSSCRLGYPSLLGPFHALLRRGLDVFSAGLYLYKMHSISADRDYVYFKMSGPPVPFQYHMSFLCQQPAGEFLAGLS